MAGAERDSHGKSQEEPGRPKRSHWARGMRSLTQSFLELFKHSRTPGGRENGRSETSHYPAGLPSRHCQAAAYPARARSNISNPSTCYGQEIMCPRSSPTIQWVPGHAGIEGERADQAAKQAASKPPGRGPREISLAFACRARNRSHYNAEAEMAH